MKNTTKKNSMRKVSAVLAMAMAMSAAVSTMAVTASAHQYEACTCNCEDTCECNCADNCTCDDTCDCNCEKTCDCEDHAEMRQPIPIILNIDGVDGRVKNFTISVTYDSEPLCPESDLAKKLLNEMSEYSYEEYDGKLIFHGQSTGIYTLYGNYRDAVPGWADPSTINVRAGYNGICASSNHDELINCFLGTYDGVKEIRISTKSWTKWWGGYGTSICLDINGSTIQRGEG